MDIWEERKAFVRIEPRIKKQLKAMEGHEPLSVSILIASVWKAGEYFLVVTSTPQGWVQMFPPFLVNKEGEILGTSNPDEYKDAVLIYENTYLKNKMRHPEELYKYSK